MCSSCGTLTDCWCVFAASLLLGMNDNNKAKRQRSDKPFSFPRQKRSVRPRMFLSIDSDSEWYFVLFSLSRDDSVFLLILNDMHRTINRIIRQHTGVSQDLPWFSVQSSIELVVTIYLFMLVILFIIGSESWQSKAQRLI